MKKVILILIIAMALFSCSLEPVTWGNGVIVDFHSFDANYNSNYKSTVVDMYFTVWNESTLSSINTLNISDFTFKEDGKAADVESISELTQEVDFNIVLLLDFSYSMVQANAIDGLKQAAISFVNQKDADSQIAVVKFSSGHTLIQPFTTDITTLETAINQIDSDEYDDRFTALFDAVVYSVENVFSESLTTSNALVIFSDGADNRSSTDLNLAFNSLETSNVICYAIGLGSQVDSTALTKLSTSGSYLQTGVSTELSNLFIDISNQIGSIYKIGYISPTNDDDPHNLRVEFQSSYGSGGFEFQYERD